MRFVVWMSLVLPLCNMLPPVPFTLFLFPVLVHGATVETFSAYTNYLLQILTLIGSSSGLFPMTRLMPYLKPKLANTDNYFTNTLIALASTCPIFIRIICSPVSPCGFHLIS